MLRLPMLRLRRPLLPRKPQADSFHGGVRCSGQGLCEAGHGRPPLVPDPGATGERRTLYPFGAAMNDSARIRLGVLTRTFGLAGGLRCTVETGTVPAVATPCDAWVGYTDTFGETLRLERSDRRPQEIICYFAGIDDREKAERLVDRALFMSTDVLDFGDSMAHPLLVGYRVLDEQGGDLGTIEAIFRTPAHVVWQIDRNGAEWLLPAVDQFVVEVQHAERRAVVRPIEGMIEDADEPGN